VKEFCRAVPCPCLVTSGWRVSKPRSSLRGLLACSGKAGSGELGTPFCAGCLSSRGTGVSASVAQVTAMTLWRRSFSAGSERHAGGTQARLCGQGRRTNSWLQPTELQQHEACAETWKQPMTRAGCRLALCIVSLSETCPVPLLGPGSSEGRHKAPACHRRKSSFVR